MKYLSFLIFTLSFTSFAQSTFSLPVIDQLQSHSDCQKNSENCKIEIPDSHSESFFPSYISRGSESIEKVVIVIHGTDRNANDYFHDFISNIKDPKILEHVAVIAPHFVQENDPSIAHELRWKPGALTSWKYGYNSSLPIQISSYEVIDQIIKSADSLWHPRQIFVIGHSAGGQFVQRYANATAIRNHIHALISFVPSNPSSYLYQNNLRLLNNQWQKPTDCPAYNDYIYGLNNRNTYMSQLSDAEISDNYIANNVIYLMGEADTLNADLDMSCEANTQGINRIERAQHFFQYLNTFFPTHHHQFLLVPNVGHDHSKMFSSDQFIKLLGSEDLTLDRVGGENIDSITPERLTFLMGGGANVDTAFLELIKSVKGGDLLVLSGKDKDQPLLENYNSYFMDLAKSNHLPLNSVTTVLIHSRQGSENTQLLKLVQQSEGIFFTGGDQWKYIDRIKGTRLHQEILKKLKYGFPIGGTSAGLAIMGDQIFSAEKGPIGTSDIGNNPKDSRITMTDSMFNIEELKNILIDTHFVVRDRMGRLISFLANSYLKAPSQLNGLGIDESTVLLIHSNSLSEVLGKGKIYLVRPSANPTFNENHFNWNKLEVFRFGEGDKFSFENLSIPNYFYNVINGQLQSTQSNGDIY